MGSFLKDQADDQEFRVRQGLEKVDLFFELNFDEDELRRCQELFGRIASQNKRIGLSTRVIERYPALTLATLVGHAGLAYDQGRYWESFWDELGLERDQDFENALRRGLSTLLSKFRLRDFPELRGRNYVMTMAMHAGIPVRCLGDVVEMIEGHVKQGRDATGVALLEWLTAPGMDYRLNRLDVPVRNFLRYGGEYAVDVLSRIIEFLIHTAQEPEAWNDLELDTSTTGLPSLLLGGLIDHVRDRPFLASVENQISQRGLLRSRTPLIGYSVEDEEILIGVPYPDAKATTPWKLTAGGTTREVYAERGWGVAEDDHPPTLVAITVPAREVLLVHEASAARYTIPVFESADPLLLFSVDGKLIRRSATLPRGLIMAMYPKDAQLIDALSGSVLDPIDDPTVPTGWTGWRMGTIDLAGHNSIQLRRPGRPDGPVRGVRSLGSPSFVMPDPVPGLFTPNGLQVYTERPSVDLPPHVGEEPVLWRVRARRSGDTRWIVDCEWESTTVESTLDPFDGAESTLLGMYEVEVGTGQSAMHYLAIVLVEGLQITYATTLRLPVNGGLSETVTELTAVSGLTVDADKITFDVADRERGIVVRHGDRAQRLVIRPPHAEIRVDKVGTPAQWRTSPLALSPRDFEEHSTVAIRVPGAARAVLALVDEHGTVIQQESPAAATRGVFQTSTRRFVDTTRRVANCRLAAFVDDARGKSYRITVADVRPSRLCGSVRVDGPRLLFEQMAEIDEPAAWVWAATAPWRAVARCVIHDNVAVIPEELKDSGDLLVTVFADDPFIVTTRPTRPDFDAIRVSQPGWVHDPDPDLDGLARFLSGAGQPPLTGRAIDGAWAALTMLSWSREDSISQRSRSGLLRILIRNPRAALEALGRSSVPQNDAMAFLIRTQLIDYPFSSSEPSNELHPNTWIGCMVKIADLPSLRNRGRTAAVEKTAAVAYLETEGGHELIQLLRTGTMRSPLSGIFDSNVLTVHGMPPDRVEELFEFFRLVPGALLDVDTRTSATIDAFQRRAEWILESACDDLSEFVSIAMRALCKASPVVYDLVVARGNIVNEVDTTTFPWMLLSMQSLALASVARLHALGEFEFSPITADMREAWAVMAEYFPSMVANDLLIAEGLTTYLAYEDLIGDSR